MFYYTLHHLAPETARFRDGRRNCATFILGSALYGGVWMLLQNWCGPALQRTSTVALWLLWLADALTMAYIYKAYYGRSILNELGAEDAWEYDAATHRYRRLTEEERLAQAEARTAAANETEQAREAQARGDAIAAARTIRRLWRARMIQRWWRARLSAWHHVPFMLL